MNELDKRNVFLKILQESQLFIHIKKMEIENKEKKNKILKNMLGYPFLILVGCLVTVQSIKYVVFGYLSIRGVYAAIKYILL